MEHKVEYAKYTEQKEINGFSVSFNLFIVYIIVLKYTNSNNLLYLHMGLGFNLRRIATPHFLL
jgi:hypothetical protein